MAISLTLWALEAACPTCVFCLMTSTGTLTKQATVSPTEAANTWVLTVELLNGQPCQGMFLQNKNFGPQANIG